MNIEYSKSREIMKLLNILTLLILARKSLLPSDLILSMLYSFHLSTADMLKVLIRSFSSDKRSKELVSQGAFLLAENERSHQRRKLVESNDSVSTLTEELSASGSAPQTPLSTSPANDLTSLVRKLSYTGTLPDSMTKASEVNLILVST